MIDFENIFHNLQVGLVRRLKDKFFGNTGFIADGSYDCKREEDASQKLDSSQKSSSEGDEIIFANVFVSTKSQNYNINANNTTPEKGRNIINVGSTIS